MVRKSDLCPHEESLHRFGHKHLGRAGEVADALRNGDGQSDNVIAADCDVSDMKPSAYVQARGFGSRDDLGRAPHGGCAAGERREEAVAEGLDLPAVVALESSADDGVMVVG